MYPYNCLFNFSDVIITAEFSYTDSFYKGGILYGK